MHWTKNTKAHRLLDGYNNLWQIKKQQTTYSCTGTNTNKLKCFLWQGEMARLAWKLTYSTQQYNGQQGQIVHKLLDQQQHTHIKLFTAIMLVCYKREHFPNLPE